MVRTLMARCEEVEMFLTVQRMEKKLQAKALLDSPPSDKLTLVVAYLEGELRTHREVRTLWPYLLMIPDSDKAQYFCSLYETTINGFGEAVDNKIEQLQHSLEVIDDKMGQAQVSGFFWKAVRDKLIEQVCQEAEHILTENI